MHKLEEVQVWLEMAQELGSPLSLPETLSVLAAKLTQLTPFDAMAIYAVRNQKLIPEYVIGEDLALFSSLEIPVGQGLSGRVAESRTPVLNGNPSLEAAYLNDAAKSSKLNSALAVPLGGSSGIVGVLALYRAGRAAFKRDELRILQSIATKLAIALQNSLLYRQATAASATDSLTGLPNARSLFMHLDAELSRCTRTSQPMTIMVCDLDGFQDVNRRFGRLEADRLLGLVAANLKECCREYDYVARMDDDEFVVVLPGLNSREAEPKRRQLEAAVERAGLEVCGETALTISSGKAHFETDGRTAEDLLAMAGHRMHLDKQSPEGRPYRTMQKRSHAADTNSRPVCGYALWGSTPAG